MPIPSIQNEKVKVFFSKLNGFQLDACLKFRELIFKADKDFIEEFKWSFPVYSKKEMVCAFGAFKNHVSFTFFNGALIEDKYNLFADCDAQSMRSIKISSLKEINDKQFIEYIKFAVNLKKEDVKKEKRTMELPQDLKQLLKKHKTEEVFFNKLSYTHQKEYVRWIESAKKEETRHNRLTKTISMLSEQVKHP